MGGSQRRPFFWLKLKDPLDTRKLLQPALDHGGAFMPGEPFYPEPEIRLGNLRLNFSHASEKEADRGLAKLANLFRKKTVFER
jgi:DNA-binding transcriptional MocR family regulator